MWFLIGFWTVVIAIHIVIARREDEYERSMQWMRDARAAFRSNPANRHFLRSWEKFTPVNSGEKGVRSSCPPEMRP